VVELVVDDGELTDSDTVTVTVEEPNEAPIADAGSNQRVNVGAFVQLDGSGSWDPEDDALVYTWTLTARPTTSLATLAGASTVSPSFTADAAGTYTVELIVGDGQFTSVPATVTISAETASDGGCGSCADAVQAELRRRAPGSRAATWGLALLPLLAFAVQRRR
jgi:hypothetical protein